MREHDKIVNNLKEQLIFKGFKVLRFKKNEALIAQIGYRTIRPKTSHVAFVPDIVICSNNRDEDRFFIEYIHTKNQIARDMREMILLSQIIKKARGFILIFNDKIFVQLEGIRGNIFPMNLTGCLNDLKKYPRDVFERVLQG